MAVTLEQVTTLAAAAATERDALRASVAAAASPQSALEQAIQAARLAQRVIELDLAVIALTP